MNEDLRGAGGENSVEFMQCAEWADWATQHQTHPTKFPNSGTYATVPDVGATTGGFPTLRFAPTNPIDEHPA